MILIWVTLLLLHQGYTLVPVIMVQTGEPVTFSCVWPEDVSNRKLYWYKQSPGDTLKLIASLSKRIKLKYEPEFSGSRLEVTDKDKLNTLTILRTIPEDEGMYHCVIMDWGENTWTGTYLSLKGNSQGTSNYTVVQWPTESGPVRPGDSVTLQCSVLSDPENKMCPGDHSVHWFRAGAEKSHPGMIYTAQRSDECEKKPDAHSPAQSCVYRFTKSVSSSDAGTFYCAVATCGKILFGNGTKVLISGERRSRSEFIALITAVVFLAISIIGNIVFICSRTTRPACAQFKGIGRVSSQGRHDTSNQLVQDITEGGHDLNYAALHFSGEKVPRGRKQKELKAEESVYSQVKL
ncbi:uncharacterized protein LOC121188152 [Toxotes jaculatrix]|uniref:uncharacterized protein LOC121188152 n=1 Tax=Toxotes jaculatrix TaxID=941984 RepID=UPI001B3AA6EB|nr:uncharacterized protein LOC121188152 [Toxotes jaculatrix]